MWSCNKLVCNSEELRHLRLAGKNMPVSRSLILCLLSWKEHFGVHFWYTRCSVLGQKKIVSCEWWARSKSARSLNSQSAGQRKRQSYWELPESNWVTPSGLPSAILGARYSPKPLHRLRRCRHFHFSALASKLATLQNKNASSTALKRLCDPVRIQTWNLLIRSQMLYSVELRGHHRKRKQTQAVFISGVQK